MTSDHRTEPPSVEILQEARRAVEAVLLVASDPTPVQLLAQLVELPADIVDAMCRELADEYETERRGFQLVQVAGGWRYQTHADTHLFVERYAMEGVPNRLSSAALETLAIVAYKQPISRGQIGAIRGVNVEGVLRTLVQRGYVTELGKDDGPGQATLFGTTDFFLEQVGLMSTDDLPPLGDFVPSAEVLEALEQTLKIDGDPPEVPTDQEIATDPAPEPEPEPEPTAEHGPAGDRTEDSAEGGTAMAAESPGSDGGDGAPLAVVRPGVTLAPSETSPDAPEPESRPEIEAEADDEIQADTVDLRSAEDTISEPGAPSDDPPPGDPPDTGGPPAADSDDRGRSVGPGSPEPDNVVEQSAWHPDSTDPDRPGGGDPAGPPDIAEPGITADPQGSDPQPGGAHQLDGLAARYRSAKAVTNGSTDHRQGPGDA